VETLHRAQFRPRAESSAEREERPVLIQLEGKQVGLAGYEAPLMEIGILGDDDEPVR